MAHPLMPKATAVWLVENTALTFEQIAQFCGLHELEVQAIADDEVAVGMQGLDPIAGGELTQDELERCGADPDARLEMAKPDIPQPKARTKGARYTPVAKRQDRPDAIAWLLRNHPELTDAQISKLIGTTKPTINAIRERTHWNMPNIKPQNPIGLGLCTAAELEKVVAVARARAHTVHESQAKPIEGDGGTAAPPQAMPPQPEALAQATPSPPEAPASESPAPEAPASESPAPEAPVAEPPAGEPSLSEPPAPASEPSVAAPAEPASLPATAPATPDVLKEAEDVFGPTPAATPAAKPEDDAGGEPASDPADDVPSAGDARKDA